MRKWKWNTPPHRALALQWFLRGREPRKVAEADAYAQYERQREQSSQERQMHNIRPKVYR